MAALLGFRHAPARQATRLVLVLDEFPYLVNAELALPSILQSIWDHQLKQARVKLILSGSHITAMKRLTEADQPLYGRRTGLIQTDPVHCSIIHAIANGDVQRQKISNRVGKKSASLSRPLDWFKEMEVIEQYAPITAYPNPNPKSMSYRLRDPYLHPDSTTTSVSTSSKTSAGSSSRPPDASVFPSAPSGPGNGGRPMASTRSTSSRSAPTASSC
jgi:AAA+ ATPase superfamily predicted ATPase